MADPLVGHVARALFEEFKVMAEAQNMPLTSTKPTSSDRKLALAAIRAVESYKHPDNRPLAGQCMGRGEQGVDVQAHECASNTSGS